MSRILHVFNSPKIGGTESWVLNMIAGTRTEIDNEVVMFRGDGPFAPQIDPYLRGIVPANSSKPKKILDLRRLVRDAEPDQVWLHSDLARTYGAFLKGRSGPPCVAVCHSPWAARTVEQKLNGVGRRTSWSGVIAVSDAVADELPERVRQTGQVTTLTPPPRISLDQGGESARGQGNRFVYVARMVDGKGHDVLLRAMPVVRQSYPEARLILVGDGPIRDVLMSLAHDLGISSYVEFIGETADVVPHLLAADAFVHPSESEGLSLSGVEAALAGLPIIARDLPSHASYVHEGVNGLFFNGNQPENLATTMSLMLGELVSFSRSAIGYAPSLRTSLNNQFGKSVEMVVGWR